MASPAAASAPAFTPKAANRPAANSSGAATLSLLIADMTPVETVFGNNELLLGLAHEIDNALDFSVGAVSAHTHGRHGVKS